MTERVDPPHPGSGRPAAFLPLGAFFVFGAVMSSYAAITLAVPGTVLDRAWELNPEAHLRMAPFGRILAAPFFLLSATMAITAAGWLRRRRWAWRMAIAIIATNLAGDLISAGRGDWFRGLTGMVIGSLVLVAILRPGLRGYVSSY